jgi:hypothetical protein
MTEVKETGGARIGMVNATWPFAKLTVTKDKLQLNATIIGNLIFKPGDIVSIEPYSRFMSKGIKITYNVPKYKNHVVFWTFGSASSLINKIEDTGFLTNTDPIETELDQHITASQKSGGFPLKLSAGIAIIAIWNILFIMDFQNVFGESGNGSSFGIGIQLALGFVLLTSILLLTFEPVRKLLLKKGRSINDIKTFLFFLMFICGFMLLMSILTR